MKSTLNAWLKLVRPPNLITVPGDPLAGFMLAAISVPHVENINIWMVLPCMAASLLLYMSGLMLNDYTDNQEDKIYRPERPIPSGKVSKGAVLVVGLLTGICGVAVAGVAGKLPLMVAACLAILILMYNSVARRIRPVGTLTMGLCRGCSLLLGASVLGLSSPVVIVAAVGLTFYIMEVSSVAAGEAQGELARGVRWFPAVVLFVVFTGFNCRLGELVPASIAFAVLACLWALTRAFALGKPGEGVIPRQVGLLIRGLLLVQASFCAVAGKQGLIAAACLLLLWPVGMLLSRKYYAS